MQLKPTQTDLCLAESSCPKQEAALIPLPNAQEEAVT